MREQTQVCPIREKKHELQVSLQIRQKRNQKEEIVRSVIHCWAVSEVRLDGVV